MTGKAVVCTGITLGLGVATGLFAGCQSWGDLGLPLVFMLPASMLRAILRLPVIPGSLLKEKRLARGGTPVFRRRH